MFRNKHNIFRNIHPFVNHCLIDSVVLLVRIDCAVALWEIYWLLSSYKTSSLVVSSPLTACIFCLVTVCAVVHSKCVIWSISVIRVVRDLFDAFVLFCFIRIGLDGLGRQNKNVVSTICWGMGPVMRVAHPQLVVYREHQRHMVRYRCFE